MNVKTINFFLFSLLLWLTTVFTAGCNSVDQESYGFLYRQINTDTPQLWYCSADGEMVNPGMPVPGLISGDKIIFQLGKNDTIDFTYSLKGSRLTVMMENGNEFLFDKQSGLKAAAPLFNTRFELSKNFGPESIPPEMPPVWIGMDFDSFQLGGFGGASRFGCSFQHRIIFQNEYCTTGRIRFFALGYEGTKGTHTEWEKGFFNRLREMNSFLLVGDTLYLGNGERFFMAFTAKDEWQYLER